MAKCSECGREMNTAGGCNKPLLLFLDRYDLSTELFARIPVGDPDDFYDGDPEDTVCHDCGAKFGHIHHYGCDAETCPKCGGQLISCDCSWGNNIYTMKVPKGLRKLFEVIGEDDEE